MKMEQQEKSLSGRDAGPVAKEGERHKSPWTDYRSDC